MALRVSIEWKSTYQGTINMGLPVEVTSKHNIVIQELVIMLSKAQRPYKIFNLGAGVKQITTNTEVCPCCKRAL